MNVSKIIKGVVGGGRYTVTAPITQWDYGYIFQPIIEDLPTTYRLDFSNDEHSGTAYPVYCGEDGGEVPQSLIDTGKDIFVWLFYIGDGFGKTEYKWRIPNKLKPKNEEETPEPSQQSSIDQLIVRSNEAVETAETSASEASTSAQSAKDDADRAEEAKDTAGEYANDAEGHARSAQASAESASASARASAQSASEAETARQATTSLVAEAQRYANASEQSAAASANSASQAQGFAQSASASANSASGYASQADISANTASNKASEASTSASTASAKATESAQSATNASQSAQTAEQAKTDAQTAQGIAESAKDDAITAKNGAESARDEAQNLVDGISGKVEQIDSNTERIESLEDDRYKPYVVDSASGSIASFPDGADGIPLKSLVVNIDPVQDLSNGDPSPENICPISGWAECNIQRDGTNLFDGEMENGDINQYTGENNGTSSSRYRSKNYIPIRTGSYYFKSPNRTGTVRVFAYDKNKEFIAFTAWNLNAVNAVNDEKTKYIRFRFGTGKVDGDEQISINSPSSVTDYVPYVGQTIPISWQTEAGTVYGGKLDVLSGVLRVTNSTIDLATLSGWANNMTGSNAIEIRCTLTGKKEGRTNIISNLLKTGTETSATDVAVFSIRGYPTSSTIAVKVPKTVAQDSSKVVTWIANNHPMACYELAEPIEIQLTPHEVKSLLGANNIFADTGDTEVEYRADTKLYIEKLTQPEEDDMIADSAITSGQFFMVGNTLYRALANIASGATITVGTNAQRVSLSDALNIVNA